MTFFVQVFDSKTSILGTLGGHFGTLWLHFGGIGHPRGRQGGTPGIKGGFLVDFGYPWGPLGGSFWVHFVNVCVFFVSKVAVGLQSCFLSGFEVEK